jgi:hypothetical protein
LKTFFNIDLTDMISKKPIKLGNNNKEKNIP